MTIEVYHPSCFVCSVEKFSHEMDTLLEITLRSTLVEKLSMALYDCLFEFEDLVDEQQEGKVRYYVVTLQLLLLNHTILVLVPSQLPLLPVLVVVLLTFLLRLQVLLPPFIGFVYRTESCLQVWMSMTTSLSRQYMLSFRSVNPYIHNSLCSHIVCMYVCRICTSMLRSEQRNIVAIFSWRRC